jgi:hypothetical protein
MKKIVMESFVNLMEEPYNKLEIVANIKKDDPMTVLTASNKRWETREDKKLIKLVQKMKHTGTAKNGKDFEEIAHQFKGTRTSLQFINRWEYIKKRPAVAVAVAGGGINDPNKKPPRNNR